MSHGNADFRRLSGTSPEMDWGTYYGNLAVDVVIASACELLLSPSEPPIIDPIGLVREAKAGEHLLGLQDEGDEDSHAHTHAHIYIYTRMPA